MTQPAAQHSLAPLVAQLCEVAALDPPAMELLDPTFGPREYIVALDAAGQHVDALNFLAHLLPRREGVWWAWTSARRVAGDDPPPPIAGALQATERWIARPTEEHRRAAMLAGEAAGFDTPAGCAALAAFLSGGSLAPEGAAEVPPPRFAASRAVFGGLVFSAVAREPETAPEKYRSFLAFGLELAERIRLWDSLERLT